MPKSEFVALKPGASVDGREIHAYVNNAASSQYIYLMAGVHGDEPEGVYILKQLFSWLQQQKLAVAIVVIPRLNPDGLAANMRVNANGVDLNRNWPSHTWTKEYEQARYNPGGRPLSEPENIFLYNLFTQYKPSFIFSFHTWRPLLDHNAHAADAAKYIASFCNYEVVDNIGYPTPGSLGSYVDDKLGCGIITYELPPASTKLSMQDIWQQNAIGLQNYFLHYLKQ